MHMGAVAARLSIIALSVIAVTSACTVSPRLAASDHPVPRAPAVTANPAGGVYAALGDSYTSSPLLPTQSMSPLGCLRSAKSYPVLVAKALHPRGFADVSCYGASTADLTRPERTVLGTNPPQLNAVRKADSLVTVQIGGNDVGFDRIIVTCGLLSLTDPFGAPCKAHYTSGGTDRLARAVSRTAPKVAAALRRVRRRAPHARIMVVGYPDVLPVHGTGCWPQVPVARGDLAYLNGLEHKLNRMLARQAAASGDSYVNTYAGSIGHDACQRPGVSWVEGLIPTSLAIPFHPNALGARAMARRVVAALRQRRRR
jgi:lysophospholipase L1-like esterase